LLRGARVRADRYTADHSLRQLQNEFKSGLRELDAVKAELAGSMMIGSAGAGGGMMGGGGLGASVSGVDRIRSNRGAAVAARGVGGGWEAATQMIDATSTLPPLHAGVTNTFPLLAPRSRSVAAVAEEEWEKRGIGFRSIAEGGGMLSGGVDNNNANNDGGLHHHPNNSISTINGGGGGAVILSNYLRQSLIYDQYDRTVREQDEALRTRVEKVRNERNTLDAIAKSSSSSQK
jgi:hypothetical protein